MAGKKKYKNDDERKEARRNQVRINVREWRNRGDTDGYRADCKRSKQQWATMKELKKACKKPSELVEPWVLLWDQYTNLTKDQQTKFINRLHRYEYDL